MPANVWQPPQTGDGQLDRSFLDLADRLAGMDALLASVAIPGVLVTTKNVTLTDQSYIEVRGSSAVAVTLPPAAFRGTGRGSMLTIQNFSTAAVTVRVQPGDILNDGSAFAIAVNTGALFSGNGVVRWTGLKAGGGHIIENDGVPFATRRNLNFLPSLLVTDNPGDDATEVDVVFPTFSESMFPWISGVYYPCVEVDAADGGLTFSTAAAAADTLYAIPRVFRSAGTIDYMAQHFSGQGGSTHDVYHAIYRDNGSGLPGTRVFDHQYTSATIGNFAGSKLETNCNISVSAGEIIWFASVQRVTNNPQQLASTRAKLLPLLGTNFDGTGGTNPNRSYVIGYAVSFSYAQPPSTWSGTTLLLAGAADVPMPLIKFTPA